MTIYHCDVVRDQDQIQNAINECHEWIERVTPLPKADGSENDWLKAYRPTLAALEWSLEHTKEEILLEIDDIQKSKLDEDINDAAFRWCWTLLWVVKVNWNFMLR